MANVAANSGHQIGRGVAFENNAKGDSGTEAMAKAIEADSNKYSYLEVSDDKFSVKGVSSSSSLEVQEEAYE
jgi:hypothetical protein